MAEIGEFKADGGKAAETGRHHQGKLIWDNGACMYIGTLVHACHVNFSFHNTVCSCHFEDPRLSNSENENWAKWIRQWGWSWQHRGRYQQHGGNHQQHSYSNSGGHCHRCHAKNRSDVPFRAHSAKSRAFDNILFCGFSLWNEVRPRTSTLAGSSWVFPLSMTVVIRAGNGSEHRSEQLFWQTAS